MIASETPLAIVHGEYSLTGTASAVQRLSPWQGPGTQDPEPSRQGGVHRYVFLVFVDLCIWPVLEG